jgi:hypothetical protein
MNKIINYKSIGACLLLLQFASPYNINLPPIIWSFGTDQKEGRRGEQFKFFWTAFDVNLSDDLTCQFKYGDEISQEISCSTPFGLIVTEPGLYPLSIIVRDGRGGETTRISSIKIKK